MSSRSTLLLLTSVMAACGRYGFSPPDAGAPEDAATDAPAVCTPDCAGLACGPDGCGDVCGTCAVGDRCESGTCVETACTTDADCLACERCESNVCVPVDDGLACAGGLCHAGACCVGCWNGSVCQPGATAEACGAGGLDCDVCGIPANGSVACRTAACEYTCDDGFFDCDGSPEIDCEIDGRTDSANCGGCDLPCGECEVCAGSACLNAPDGTPCSAGQCRAGACVADPCAMPSSVGDPSCALIDIVQSGIGSSGFDRAWRGQDISFTTDVVITGFELMDQGFASPRLSELRLMTAVTALSTLASATTISHVPDGLNVWERVTLAPPAAVPAGVERTVWFRTTMPGTTTTPGCDLTVVSASWRAHYTDVDPDGASSTMTPGNWEYQYGTNLRVYGYRP